MEIPVTSNPLLDRLPKHLGQYIKAQDYDQYTPINQAVWRYVMRKNVAHLSQVAHESYMSGLKKTGISIDNIPSMYGMNRILKEIGWAAVAVDGFIPPNAFMEFQAYKVLVIASDIRQLENIEYTPAPDIIHEGAGHAPIIASPDYAEYLRRFGEIGARAISNAHDMDMYEAVRKLSILKEAEGIAQEEIDAAEDEVNRLQQMTVEPSEIALIRNLHWWTVEYGLIGTLEDPKLYGAGLLSSLGESKHCLTDAVKKLPYSIDAAYQEFDITQMQPQLFVTPDFGYLMEVLEEFAETMALRRGGWRGVQKLIDCKQLGSIELNTGLQVSGNFSNMIQDEDNRVVYFETHGPSALSYRGKELIGLGTTHFRKGFSSPLGKLKRSSMAIENMSPRDLKAFEIYEGGINSFEFESGITVTGMITTGTRSVDGTLLVVHFDGCEVSYKGDKLISRKNGPFDMAIGTSVVSAFAGAADHDSFDIKSQVSTTTTIQHELSEEDKKLNEFYREVRAQRESGNPQETTLLSIFETVKKQYPTDWLLSLEIFELTRNKEVLTHLESLMISRANIAHLIKDGLSLVMEDNGVIQ